MTSQMRDELKEKIILLIIDTVNGFDKTYSDDELRFLIGIGDFDKRFLELFTTYCDKSNKEARIDELSHLRRMEFENGDDDFTYYAVDYVYARLSELKDEVKE